jgi:hypothetical protein
MSLRIYASDRDRENTLLYNNRSEKKESDESSFFKDILLLEIIRFMTKIRKIQPGSRDPDGAKPQQTGTGRSWLTYQHKGWISILKNPRNQAKPVS